MWIDDLMFAMADVRDQDQIEPEGELTHADEVVGEVPRELRQLYTLMVCAKTDPWSQGELHNSRLGLAMSGRGRARYAATLKAETLRNIFLLSVYKLVCPDHRWPLDELQVRKGWKIVRLPIHC